MFGGPRRRGGLVRTVGRTAAVAGTASVVSGRVQRRQSARWADEQQSAAEQQQAAYEQGVADAAPPPPAPAAAPDTVSELERLVKLRDAGALTDEEFAAEKAKILAG
jgi:hypothetical protein